MISFRVFAFSWQRLVMRCRVVPASAGSARSALKCTHLRPDRECRVDVRREKREKRSGGFIAFLRASANPAAAAVRAGCLPDQDQRRRRGSGCSPSEPRLPAAAPVFPCDVPGAGARAGASVVMAVICSRDRLYVDQRIKRGGEFLLDRPVGHVRSSKMPRGLSPKEHCTRGSTFHSWAGR